MFWSFFLDIDFKQNVITAPIKTRGRTTDTDITFYISLTIYWYAVYMSQLTSDMFSRCLNIRIIVSQTITILHVFNLQQHSLKTGLLERSNFSWNLPQRVSWNDKMIFKRYGYYLKYYRLDFIYFSNITF